MKNVTDGTPFVPNDCGCGDDWGLVIELPNGGDVTLEVHSRNDNWHEVVVFSEPGGHMTRLSHHHKYRVSIGVAEGIQAFLL